MADRPTAREDEQDEAGGSVDPADEIKTTVDTVVAAGQMLASPRKCKIWHETWLADGLTIQGIASATSIPQSTSYDLTREMVDEGSLYSAGTTENKATILKPTPMHVFVSEHPQATGPEFNIHSTLIGVVGRADDFEDVETFLERNNYTLLVEAITGVLLILGDSDVEAESLTDLYGWIDGVDAHLIQGHIAAVIKRESETVEDEWEFPDDPVIDPAE